MEFYVPFFGVNQPKEIIESEKDDDHDLLKSYLDTPCLLLSDDDTSSCASERQEDRRVRFDAVRVRDHAVTVGDHPMCGLLPLTLDWNYLKEKVYDINDFESMRNLSRNGRKNVERLDYWKRKKILEDVGSSNISNQTERLDAVPFFEIEVYPDMDSFGVTVEIIED